MRALPRVARALLAVWAALALELVVVLRPALAGVASVWEVRSWARSGSRRRRCCVTRSRSASSRRRCSVGLAERRPARSAGSSPVDRRRRRGRRRGVRRDRTALREPLRREAFSALLAGCRGRRATWTVASLASARGLRTTPALRPLRRSLGLGARRRARRIASCWCGSIRRFTRRWLRLRWRSRHSRPWPRSLPRPRSPVPRPRARPRSPALALVACSAFARSRRRAARCASITSGLLRQSTTRRSLGHAVRAGGAARRRPPPLDARCDACRAEPPQAAGRLRGRHRAELRRTRHRARHDRRAARRSRGRLRLRARRRRRTSTRSRGSAVVFDARLLPDAAHVVLGHLADDRQVHAPAPPAGRRRRTRTRSRRSFVPTATGRRRSTRPPCSSSTQSALRRRSSESHFGFEYRKVEFPGGRGEGRPGRRRTSAARRRLSASSSGCTCSARTSRTRRTPSTPSATATSIATTARSPPPTTPWARSSSAVRERAPGRRRHRHRRSRRGVRRARRPLPRHHASTKSRCACRSSSRRRGSSRPHRVSDRRADHRSAADRARGLAIPRAPAIRGRDSGPLLAGTADARPGSRSPRPTSKTLLAEGTIGLSARASSARAGSSTRATDPGEHDDVAPAADRERFDRLACRAAGARGVARPLRARGPPRRDGKGWPAAILRGLAGDGDAATDLAACSTTPTATSGARPPSCCSSCGVRRPRAALRLALGRDEDAIVRRWCAARADPARREAPLASGPAPDPDPDWRRLAALALAEAGDARGERDPHRLVAARRHGRLRPRARAPRRVREDPVEGRGLAARAIARRRPPAPAHRANARHHRRLRRAGRWSPRSPTSATRRLASRSRDALVALGAQRRARAPPHSLPRRARPLTGRRRAAPSAPRSSIRSAVPDEKAHPRTRRPEQPGCEGDQVTVPKGGRRDRRRPRPVRARAEGRPTEEFASGEPRRNRSRIDLKDCPGKLPKVPRIHD